MAGAVILAAIRSPRCSSNICRVTERMVRSPIRNSSLNTNQSAILSDIHKPFNRTTNKDMHNLPIRSLRHLRRRIRQGRNRRDMRKACLALSQCRLPGNHNLLNLLSS